MRTRVIAITIQFGRIAGMAKSSSLIFVNTDDEFDMLFLRFFSKSSGETALGLFGRGSMSRFLL